MYCPIKKNKKMNTQEKNIYQASIHNRFWIVNKNIHCLLEDNDASILFSYIHYEYFLSCKNNNCEIKDIEGRNYFHKTVKEIEEATFVPYSKQNTIIKVLSDGDEKEGWSGYGFLKVKRAGIPAKKYFHVDSLRIYDYCYGSLKLEPGLLKKAVKKRNKRYKTHKTSREIRNF